VFYTICIQLFSEADNLADNTSPDEEETPNYQSGENTQTLQQGNTIIE